MEGRLWRAVAGGRSRRMVLLWNQKQKQKQEHGLRFLTQKASNRAAVHGVKRPINQKIDEVDEEEIKKGKREKQSKRKEVEKKIDSQVKSNQDSNK